jgi:Rrf2 family protein
MIFSKSFGYALRGVLYIGMAGESKSMVQLDEIARELTIPRHFLGKVMKKLVKEGVLSSQKGPYGGFCINENTKKTTLLELVDMTGEPEEFSSCVLRLRKCNAKNPCPMHHKIVSLREQWQTLLTSTTIGDIFRKDMPDFIKSIAVI